MAPKKRPASGGSGGDLATFFGKNKKHNGEEDVDATDTCDKRTKKSSLPVAAAVKSKAKAKSPKPQKRVSVKSPSLPPKKQKYGENGENMQVEGDTKSDENQSMNDLNILRASRATVEPANDDGKYQKPEPHQVPTVRVPAVSPELSHEAEVVGGGSNPESGLITATAPSKPVTQPDQPVIELAEPEVVLSVDEASEEANLSVGPRHELVGTMETESESDRAVPATAATEPVPESQVSEIVAGDESFVATSEKEPMATMAMVPVDSAAGLEGQAPCTGMQDLAEIDGGEREVHDDQYRDTSTGCLLQVQVEVEAACAVEPDQPDQDPVPTEEEDHTPDEEPAGPSLTHEERRFILSRMFRWPFLAVYILYRFSTHPCREGARSCKETLVKVLSDVRVYVKSSLPSFFDKYDSNSDHSNAATAAGTDDDHEGHEGRTCPDSTSPQSFFDNLRSKIEGMTISTCFSGVDTPCTSYMGIAWAVCREAGCSLENIAQPRNLFAVEKFSKSREELLRHPHQAEHIFDDVECFWKPHVKNLLKHNEPTESFIETVIVPAVLSGEAATDSAYCSRHKRICKARLGNWSCLARTGTGIVSL